MLRSGLSKYLMVHVNNPHYEDLVNSFKDMLKDKGAKKALNKKLGNYPWMVGTVIEDVHMRIWDSLDKINLKNMETIRRSFGENSNINPKLN